MLKIPKKVRALPWPEPYTGAENIHFRVTVRQPVSDGRRLLVVTFTMNEARRNALRWSRVTGKDLRLVCDKKNRQTAVLERGGRAYRRQALTDALSKCFAARPEWCYPEMAEGAEDALSRWLGCKDTTNNHRMEELARWVADTAEAEELAEKRQRGEILDEDVTQCPEELPEGLVDYIRRVMLPEDDGLLYKKGGRRGMCFLCRQPVRAPGTERFAQGRVRPCPSCGRDVRHVLEGGAMYAAEAVGNVVAMQRGREPGTLFLREWRLERDLTAQWEDIPKHLKETARWMLRGFHAAKWQHEEKVAVGMMRTERAWRSDWERVRSVTEGYDGGYYFCLPENWREIVAGTPLHYCPLTDFGEGRRCRVDPLRMAVDWPRYPAVEKFYKAGYVRLIEERVWRGGKELRYAANWKADSIDGALRFPKRLLRLHPPAEWQLEQIDTVNRLWKLVQNGRMQEREIGAFLESGMRFENVSAALGHVSVSRIAAWLESQRTMARQRFDEEERRRVAAAKGGKAYYSRMFHGTTAETYRDYLADCLMLGLDLDDRAVLLPQDLEAAHRRTIAQVKHKANEAMREAFHDRAAKLEKWRWESGGLLIRPAADADELIGEGAALHHCVGGYADRMAKGETAIFFIRRLRRPEESYYTLELRDGRVIQCRTRHNAGYERDQEVYDFVAEWLRDVVHKKRKNKKEDAA